MPSFTLGHPDAQGQWLLEMLPLQSWKYFISILHRQTEKGNKDQVMCSVISPDICLIIKLHWE